MLLTMLALAIDPPLGPEPVGDPAEWISADDYPSDAMHKEAGGTVFFDVSIDPTGRAARCRVLVSSGLSSLDQVACAAIMKRGKWRPTLDDAGKPIFATFRRRVAWRMPDAGYKRAAGWQLPAADMEVEVAKLIVPPEQAKVTVRQIQTAAGAQESCTVVRSSEIQALDRAACKVAEPLTKLDPIGDAAGNRVRGVRWRTIQFVQQATTRPAS